MLGCPASQGWKRPNGASPEAAAAPKHSWGKEGRQQLRESPAPCLWSQNRPKAFINSRAQDTSTGIGVLPVVSTQGRRHEKPAGICKAFQGLKTPVVMLPSCESMHLLHTSPQPMYIKLFSSWLEETRSLEVLRAGSFPLLPGKRNSPAEKQVSAGCTTRTVFAGMQKPHGPQFATTDVPSDSLPSSAHPSQAQKDAAGDEALPKRRPSCNTFSICLPHTLPFYSHSFHLQATRQKLQLLVRNCQNPLAGQQRVSQAFSSDMSDTPTQAAASSTYQPCSEGICQHFENGTNQPQRHKNRDGRDGKKRSAKG